MTTKPEIATRDHIRRWTDKGVLASETAQELLAELDSFEAANADARPAAAINGGLEALGYLGSALVLGALGYLFDVASWPQAAISVLLALVAAGTAWGVIRLTPAQDGPMARLATVIGFSGVCSFAALLALTFAPSCLDNFASTCGWAPGRLAPLLLVALATVPAGLLYRREQNMVTHALMGCGVVASLVFFSLVFFAAESRSFRAQDIATALVILPAAIAWVWASESGRLNPAWIGTLGASGAILASTITLTEFDLFSDNAASVVATMGLGLTYVVIGSQWDRWRLTALGAITLLFTVPWWMVDQLGLSATTTAMILLPVGLATTAFVLRQLKTRTQRPD